MKVSYVHPSSYINGRLPHVNEQISYMIIYRWPIFCIYIHMRDHMSMSIINIQSTHPTEIYLWDSCPKCLLHRTHACLNGSWRINNQHMWTLLACSQLRISRQSKLLSSLSMTMALFSFSFDLSSLLFWRRPLNVEMSSILCYCNTWGFHWVKGRHMGNHPNGSSSICPSIVVVHSSDPLVPFLSLYRYVDRWFPLSRVVASCLGLINWLNATV